MAIQQGDKMPSGVFGIMTDSGPGAISTDELFAGKKVVLVAVPGAFTPTCSANHLPGFIDKADDLSAKGVDTVACMSVNDVFVMDAWGKDREVGDKVVMLADGNGEYAAALGLEMDASGQQGRGGTGQPVAFQTAKGSIPASPPDGRRGGFHASHRTRTALLLLQGLFQLRHDREQVTYQADVRDFENWRVLVLVYSDDCSGIFDAGQVLDGARDTDSNIQFGRNDLASLADLHVVGNVTRVDRRTRCPDPGAHAIGE